MERKFLDFSLPGSKCSTERKCSTGAKVLSMVFSLPGTKVQRNEKASYRYISTSPNSESDREVKE